MWPTSVILAYDDDTCIGHPIAAPGLMHADSNEFKVHAASVIKVGTFEIAARGMCLKPAKTPQPGNYLVRVVMPGLPFIAKNITVQVPQYPVASAVHLKEPVPISKKLIIALNTSDKIFSYILTVGDKSVKCEPQALGVACDIENLGLVQGSEYGLRLDRYFNNSRVDTVLETEIKTLPEVVLVSSSIKNKEMVYEKPKSVTLQFNKQILSAVVSLVEIDGHESRIDVHTKLEGDKVTVSWPNDLERQKTHRLTLEYVEGKDGSTLGGKDSSVTFETSGGPKVKSISVGTYKVALGTTAVITFDQPLMEGQNISDIVNISGGAKIIRQQGATLTVSFAGVPKCSNVTFKITDDLKSDHGISGGTSWQFTTRTICQTVISIGTSVNKRPIYGYILGSGSKTVVYTGTIHGDEVSTRSLLFNWIDALEANPSLIPANKRVIVIPTINPDGFASGSRTNARNVDLNRNFNTSDWRKDITTVSNQPFPGGGGKTPLSEPESAALAGYIAAIKPVLVLSYHSIGGLLAANQAGSSGVLAKRYAALSGYANSTGSSDTFDYSISGTADDYYAEKLGVASILIELGSHTYHQFERNRSAMLAVLQES